MVVLLNVALTWAIPSASIILLTFLPMAIVLLRYLLLAGDSAAWTLLGAGVGVRALATNRKPAPVTHSHIRANVHEPLDVHRDFGAEGPLDAKILFDRLAKLVGISIAEIANALLGVCGGRLG